MKPAGGIRTAKQAVQYLCRCTRRSAPRWLTPELFRIGASTLERRADAYRKQRTGLYQSPDYFTID